MCNWRYVGLMMMVSMGVQAAMVDPTKPALYTAPVGQATTQTVTGGDSLLLTSILASSTRRIAIINGELKREGDTVGEYVIVKIMDYQVELQSGDETTVVSLGSTIRQASKDKEAE